MNKLYINMIIISQLLVAFQVHAGILEGGYKGISCKLTGGEKIYNPKGAGKNVTDIAFSLVNKSNEAIYIQVKNGNILQRLGQELTQGASLLPKGAVVELKLDISKPTCLAIYTKNNKKIIEAEFPTNQTLYINWNGKNIYRQQGPLMGITGVNDNCYSLKNNVGDKDILVRRFS